MCEGVGGSAVTRRLRLYFTHRLRKRRPRLFNLSRHVAPKILRHVTLSATHTNEELTDVGVYCSENEIKMKGKRALSHDNTQ